MKLSVKLGMGFASITSILVIAVSTTIWQVSKTTEVNNRLIDLRAPTAQSSLMILNGINHSLAALRGWIILGKDKFKDERSKAWSDEIMTSLKKMQSLSVSWTDSKNIESLRVIEEKLEDFKKYQKEIEDIAQTTDNTPALKILFEQAAPQAVILTENITKMINAELKLEATPKRKALLGMMADVRGTTGLALANIRAYLLSGNDKFKKLFDKLWEKNTRRFGDLETSAALLTPEQKKAFNAFSEARRIFSPLPPEMFRLRGSAEWNLANAWLGTKAAPTAFAIKKELDAMIKSQHQLMQADSEEAKRMTTVLDTLEWILLFAGIIISALVGTFMTRSITKPINRTIRDLTEGSSQVTSASGQISSSSQSMAEGASEQASSLEETSSSLEEMSSMTRRNAENTRQAASLSNEANEAAGQGIEAMERMADSISKIKKSSEETAKIIKTIDEIAFQTNLLALNAAVEAARAGEAGKGFAVVAEEVRNLAQRSAGAARSTSDMIEESQKNADSGVKVGEEVAKTLNEINEKVKKVNTLVNEIATSSDEQARGVDQINTAVTQMDKVTQSNASNAEETASASEELNAQAAQLNDIIGGLVKLVGNNSNKEDTGISRQLHEPIPHVEALYHAPLHEEIKQDRDRLKGEKKETQKALSSAEKMMQVEDDFKSF